MLASGPERSAIVRILLQSASEIVGMGALDMKPPANAGKQVKE
jgi:hypothetical protein